MVKRIAVVGGGIFGATTAIHAARTGYHVELFEKSNRLLGAASGINQFRLHQGYHYPRSDATVLELQEAMDSFEAEYGGCLVGTKDCFYAIAKQGSRITGADYLDFCRRLKLPFEIVEPVNSSLEIMIRVAELRIDPHAWYQNIERKLAHTGVRVHLNSPASAKLRDRFDQIVIAGYASNNKIAVALDCPARIYQYEVVEKPVIRLPEAQRQLSLVVMDGPFCCIDPLGTTDLHLMGHVEHALHSVNDGIVPYIPDHLAGYLDRGVIEAPQGSRFEKFRKAGMVYMPFLEHAEHIGSMFTVRTVLPKHDHDDARPTLVRRIDDQCISIFSGKIGTAVSAARRAVEMFRTSPQKKDDPVLLAG